VGLKCIFFLTFARRDSIYESRCDFSKSQIRIGESVNEERNQEGRCEEESCSEEKEVASRAFGRTHQTRRAPATEPFFSFVVQDGNLRAIGNRPQVTNLRYFFTNFCTALFTVSAT
jgi:hypothetical protein